MEVMQMGRIDGPILVEFQKVIFFEEVLGEWLGVANTLQGGVHKTRVAKVTEPRCPRRNATFMNGRSCWGGVFGL